MLIGISGKKRVGKDTAFNFIAKYLNLNKYDIYCVKFSFATSVKETTSLMFDIDLNLLEGDKTKILKYNMTARDMLKYVGEIGRNIHEDFWINNYKSIVEKHKTHSLPIIFTDVRFKNEADFIKNNGGILIRIERDLNNEDNHKSECDLDDYKNFNYIITKDKNKDLESLEKEIFKIMDHITRTDEFDSFNDV